MSQSHPLQNQRGCSKPFDDGHIETSAFHGVSVSYEQSFFVEATLPIVVKENVVAVEVNVIPLDIWNEAQRTLSLTEIADLAAGGHELEGRWRIFSESDAGSIAHVIAFVRKVRLKDGSVLIADMAPVLDAVKALNENISEDDIAPGQDDPNN